jgi:hypothetical protein
MSEPRFGNRNSALEIVARDFIALDIISKEPNQYNLKISEYGVVGSNFNLSFFIPKKAFFSI